MIGIYPAPGMLIPLTPPLSVVQREWDKFNLMTPLYLILTKHKFTLNQIHYLIYANNRISGKIGRVRRAVLGPARSAWKNDREAWKAFENWLEVNM